MRTALPPATSFIIAHLREVQSQPSLTRYKSDTAKSICALAKKYIC